MNTPTRKKRKDCFLGFHSDFHAQFKEGVKLGATLDEQTIREVCETLKPDFIQIDCKGHPGFTSYPTSFSNAYPEIEADILALWRKVTKEYGISLYMHFSGVYDIKYCAEHPEEASLNADGTLSNFVRLDSKYFDEYFIPQISEVVEKYDVDGFWIDGDCWAVRPDYREETIEKFQKETGINLNGNIPKTKEDKYFKEFLDYFRDGFRKVLNHYVDVLHSKYPNLEICSNWAFSDHMPEKVSANVDFLSGDLNPANCLNSARYAGRMIAQQNMPWDLMSWNFRLLPYNDMPLLPPKHPSQVMQEAAAVIALGGAYQDNISQFNDGTHDIVQIRRIKELYEFLRERQDYCFKAKFVHEAVMLVPTYDRYHEIDAPFSRDGMDKFMGLVALLCDSGLSLETACEHTLKGRYNEYPLIVIPELYEGISDDTANELKNYVANGGNLLIIGAKTSKLFSDYGFGFEAQYYTEPPELPAFANCDVGHDFESLSTAMPSYFSIKKGLIGSTTGACKISANTNNNKVFGSLFTNVREENGVPFAQSYPFSRGKVAVIGMDLGTHYNDGMQYLHRELIKNITDELYTKKAKIESSKGLLEIVLLTKNNRLLLQLVNANGNHTSDKCISEDYIPPVLDAKLSVALDTKPKSVTLQPENKPLEFEYKNSRVYFKVDRVDVHNIVEII